MQLRSYFHDQKLNYLQNEIQRSNFKFKDPISNIIVSGTDIKRGESDTKSTVFRKIMVATDGSELVKRAVDFAIEIAKLSEAKLYAVHVVSLGGDLLIPSKDKEWKRTIEEQLTIEGKKATAYVENIGRTANVEVEPVILEGNPANEILDFAEKNDIDLIVMGTHGKTGIQKFFMGSVSENVVRHSERAVLVVRGESADLLFKALLKSEEQTQ